MMRISGYKRLGSPVLFIIQACMYCPKAFRSESEKLKQFPVGVEVKRMKSEEARKSSERCPVKPGMTAVSSSWPASTGHLKALSTAASSMIWNDVP